MLFPVVFENTTDAVEQTQVRAFGHDQVIDEFQVEFFEVFLERGGGFEVGFRGNADAAGVVVPDDDPAPVVAEDRPRHKAWIELDTVVLAVAPFTAENPVGVVENDQSKNFIALITDPGAQIADGCQRIFDEIGGFEIVFL